MAKLFPLVRGEKLVAGRQNHGRQRERERSSEGEKMNKGKEEKQDGGRKHYSVEILSTGFILNIKQISEAYN